MKKDLNELLINGLNDLNINIDDNQLRSFDIFLKELTKWNSKYNLTAINDKKEIIIKHFLDSSVISKKTEYANGNVIDMGSGAGFPCIVLKILRPALCITSVDSSEKKIYFQKNVMRKLKINSIDFVTSRMEDSPFIQKYSNSFDCAITRAFKPVSEILTLAYPVVKKEGIILIFKGKNYKYEIDELKGNEIADRFTFVDTESYTLPYIKREHYILVYQKN